MRAHRTDMAAVAATITTVISNGSDSYTICDRDDCSPWCPAAVEQRTATRIEAETAIGMTTLAAIDPIAQARAVLAQPDAPAHRLRQHLAAVLPLAERADRCPLTGLWTRAEWMRQTTLRVAAGRPCAVLFLDLDGFKAINDTCGHDAGDAILRAVAARLDKWCQDVDGIGARLGGDELILCVPANGWLETERAVLRDEVTAPVEYDGRMLRFGASIGAAAVPPGSENAAEERLSAAMRQADLAMYRDKATRRGGAATDRRGRLVNADGDPGASTGPQDAAGTGRPVPAAVLPPGRSPAGGRPAEE